MEIDLFIVALTKNFQNSKTRGFDPRWSFFFFFFSQKPQLVFSMYWHAQMPFSHSRVFSLKNTAYHACTHGVTWRGQTCDIIIQKKTFFNFISFKFNFFTFLFFFSRIVVYRLYLSFLKLK